MNSLYIVFACFFWALDAVFRYPLIGKGVPVSQIVTFEHLIALLILAPLFFKNYKNLFLRQNVVEFLFIGCFGSALATLAFSHSFSLMNPSVVIILQKLQPLVAIVFARIVLGEKITPRFFSLGLICLFGALLISWEDFLVFLQNYKSQKMLGYFFSLIAVFGWGLSTVYGRKLANKGFKEIEIMLGRFIYSFIVLAPLSLFSYQSWVMEPSFFQSVITLVIISAICGMFFYYRGLRFTPARRATLLELFFPVFAILINWVVLGKTLSLMQIIGSVILILGATALQLKKY